MLKKVVVPVAVIFAAASSVYAESGVFVNTAAAVSNSDFFNVANWTNETGAAVSSLPFASAATSDTAILGDMATYQEIAWDQGENYFFGTLINNSPLRVFSVGSKARSKNITVANPDGWKGVVRANTRYVQLASSSSATRNPSFDRIETTRGVRINNFGPRNTGVVKVGEIFGFGMIGVNAGASYVANAHGTVEIGKAGPYMTAYVPKGNSAGNPAKGGVVFSGLERCAEGGVPGDPWMHLDASRSSTVTLDGDGKVVLWSDVRGNGYPYADPITKKVATNLPSKPVLKTFGSMQYVDFGANMGRNGNDFSGQLNVPTEEEIALYGEPAALKWSEERTDISDVFYVFQDTQPTNAIPWAIGSDLGERNDFARGSYGQLFSTVSSANIRLGRVAVDGARVPYNWVDDYHFRPHVVSVSSHAANLGAGAFAVYGKPVNGYPLRTLGGTRIGEVLVYTNKLTDAEVAKVEKYLVEKWIPEKYRHKADLDMLVHPSDETKTSLTVKGGEFAIRDVFFADGHAAVVKDGDGALSVDTVTPRNIPVTVNGGEFRFKKMSSGIDDSKPAADPYLWLDASKANTMESTKIDYGEAGETNFVSRWNDCRPEQTTYAGILINAGKMPYLVPGALNGLAVMDFGPQVASSASAAGFSVPVGRMRDNSGLMQYRYMDGFVVYRAKDSSCYAVPLSTSGLSLRGSADNTLIDRSNTGDQVACSRLRFNGTERNFKDHENCWSVPDRTKFGVYSISAAFRTNDSRIEANAIGGNIVGSCRFGGCQIAEVIYYSRRLTHEERRNTEAYLMKKWGLGEHPEAQEWTKIPVMTFADGVGALVASDNDLEISKLATSSSSLTKEGEGEITVSGLSGTVSDFNVNEGSLVVVNNVTDETSEEPCFHVDAGVQESVVIAEGTENSVSRWLDKDGRDAWADSSAATMPLVKTSDGSDGLVAGMKYIDFLDFSKTSSGSAGAMRWMRSSGKLWNNTAKEIHFVFAKPAGSETFPFGDAQDLGQEGQISLSFEASGRSMFKSSSFEGLKYIGISNATNVWCLVDNTYSWFKNAWSGDSAYEQDGKFHVVSLVARGDFTFRCSNFAARWNYSGLEKPYYGGLKLAEVIVFNSTNSTLVSQSIHSGLMKKWLNVGDGIPKGNYRLGTVNVAAGCGFSVSTPFDVTVSGVKGGGTVSCEKGFALDDGAVIETEFLGAKTFSKTQVQGPVKLSATGVVSVVVPEGAKRSELTGTHKIFSASSISGTANIAGWSVSIAGGAQASDFAGMSFVLSCDETGVYLNVSQGMILFVR